MKKRSDRKKKIKSVGITYLSPAILFFSHELVVCYFNDTLVSRIHTLPVNIFNLEGGETMLARDNEKFGTQGEN